MATQQTSHHFESADDFHGHRVTYQGFLGWSVVLALISFFILVSLVAFGFMDAPLSLVAGFGGLIVGIIVSLMGQRMGGKWLFPVAVLVLYGLFVGANVHN